MGEGAGGRCAGPKQPSRIKVVRSQQGEGIIQENRARASCRKFVRSYWAKASFRKVMRSHQARASFKKVMQSHRVRVFEQCHLRSFKGAVGYLFEWSFRESFEGTLGCLLERPELVEQ